MFKLPNKFYRTGGGSGGGGSSDTPASNKKYEITITQPPEHKKKLDMFKGTLYDFNNNILLVRPRIIALNDFKEIWPDATEIPAAYSDYYIASDMFGNDIVPTSIDEMLNIISKNIILFISEYDVIAYHTPSSKLDGEPHIKIYETLPDTQGNPSRTICEFYFCADVKVNAHYTRVYFKNQVSQYWLNANPATS